MLVLVTSWYAAIDSDRTYHTRVTEYNTILPALKEKMLVNELSLASDPCFLFWGSCLPPPHGIFAR